MQWNVAVTRKNWIQYRIPVHYEKKARIKAEPGSFDHLRSTYERDLRVLQSCFLYFKSKFKENIKNKLRQLLKWSRYKKTPSESRKSGKQRGVFTILANICYANFRENSTAQKMKKSLMQNFMFCAV